LAKKLLIDKLEIKPYEHQINVEELTSTEMPKANINVTIGEYTFKVDRDFYLNWIMELKLQCGFTEHEVFREIKRRLGFEN